MKLFLDTANLEEIDQAVSSGLIDGVTTNPTLVAKEGVEFTKHVKEISELCHGPVSAEVIGTSEESMVKEARELSQLARNIVIKLPITMDGLKATYRLNREGISINVTLVFSLNQAILAERAGAAYVSPFVGRMDDIGNSGMSLVKDIVSTFNLYQYDTEVISASIRHPDHVSRAAMTGSHIATVPYQVLDKMVNHPLTDQGIERFLNDWYNQVK